MNKGCFFVYFFLILLILLQFYNGLDLTHHVHNTWIFNQMIVNQEFTIYDPYLLNGEQITFLYGSIIYTIGGVLWFLFSYYTVDVIMIIITILNFLIFKKLFKQDNLTILILMTSFVSFIQPDTFVAYFSLFLFWLSFLLLHEKRKYWKIPLILSILNHPVYLIPSLYFILKDKKLIPVFITIIAYFSIISFYFSKTGSITLYLPIVFLQRIIFALTPIILVNDFFKELNNEIKKDNIVKKLLNNVKKFLFHKLPIIHIILIVIFSIAVSLFLIGNVTSYQFSNLNEFITINSMPAQISVLFNNFPNITGIVRNVDYFWLPSILLNKEGVILTEGSFRENNDITLDLKPFYWSNETQYEEYLDENSVDYVLFCKNCITPTNEKRILLKEYALVWENEYYYLFMV